MPSPLPPTPATDGLAAKPTWRQTLRVYGEPASLRMLSLGFSAGLPLLFRQDEHLLGQVYLQMLSRQIQQLLRPPDLHLLSRNDQQLP